MGRPCVCTPDTSRPESRSGNRRQSGNRAKRAHRSDILLGKNLAMLPFALILGGIGTAALEFAFPMHLDHFLAAVIQMVSMYLVFCLVLNLLSMLAPTAVASGSLRPARPKGGA